MTERLLTDPAWELPDTRRVADFKRMRRGATGLLVLMLVLFVATSVLAKSSPWAAYPRAFAEAAIVGGCADWFAVTALFRYPLGLPIPHTAIIPRQKQRIGDALGHFIARNFLAPAEVTARIERLDAAGWLAAWLRKPETARLAIGGAQSLLSTLLDVLSEDQIRGLGRKLFTDGARSVPLAPLLSRALTSLQAQGRYDPTFDLVVDSAGRFLETHADAIRQRATKKGTSWIPGWIDVRLANGFIDELQETLIAARASLDHPWRVAGREAIQRLAARLADDPALAEQCERFKRTVLDQAAIEEGLTWLREQAKAKLRAELAGENRFLAENLEQALPAIGNWIAEDPQIRALINDWTRRLVLNTVVASRDEIGGFVSGVVARWDTGTLVDRVELQVGKDLQYIRVNGTLVGGLVGLVIFTLSRLCG